MVRVLWAMFQRGLTFYFSADEGGCIRRYWDYFHRHGACNVRSPRVGCLIALGVDLRLLN
jgi:hypothetical protein